MNQFKVWILDDGDPECEFSSCFECGADSPEDAAVFAAEDDFYHRDGWERKHNALGIFKVVHFDPDGEGETTYLEVEREFSPSFFTTPADEPEVKP